MKRFGFLQNHPEQSRRGLKKNKRIEKNARWRGRLKKTRRGVQLNMAGRAGKKNRRRAQSKQWRWAQTKNAARVIGCGLKTETVLESLALGSKQKQC